MKTLFTLSSIIDPTVSLVNKGVNLLINSVLHIQEPVIQDNQFELLTRLIDYISSPHQLITAGEPEPRQRSLSSPSSASGTSWKTRLGSEMLHGQREKLLRWFTWMKVRGSGWVNELSHITYFKVLLYTRSSNTGPHQRKLWLEIERKERE